VATFASTSVTQAGLLGNWLATYLTQTQVANKWAWNYLMKFTTHVRIEITSDPYTYGLVGAGWYWAQSSSQTVYSAVPSSGNDFPFFYWNRNMAIVDVSTSGSAELIIPWTGWQGQQYMNMHTITAASVDLPQFYLTALTPLISAATGSTGTYNGSVYVWLTDVYLDIATPVASVSKRGGGNKRGGGERMDGLISGPASAVANVGKSLSDVPVIGLFAKATEIGAGAVASIAKLFGFSKPLDTDERTTVGYPPMGYASGADQFVKHTLDPRQEVTIDCSMWGTSGDPMTFENIIGRFGLIDYYQISNSTSAGTLLSYYPVHPMYVPPAATSHAIQLTPLAFGSFLANFWRGTLKYRIFFVASKYHRGRIRISWTPTLVYGAYSDSAMSNNGLNLVVDLTSTTVVDIEVAYMGLQGFSNISAVAAGLAAGSITNSADLNGWLNIAAVDPITAPNSSAVITVLVTVAAGEDFELAGFSNTGLNQLHRDPYNASSDSLYSQTLASQTILTPVAGNLTTVAKTPTQVASVSLRSVDTVTAQVATHSIRFGPPPGDYHNVDLYVGEMYKSFRSVCKRHAYNKTQYTPNRNSGYLNYYCIPYAPEEPGIYANNSSTVCNSPSVWTPISWLAMLFKGMRGSVRTNIVFIGCGTASGLPPALDNQLVATGYVIDNPGAVGVVQIDLGNGLGSDIAVAQNFANIINPLSGLELHKPVVGQAIQCGIPWLNTVGYLPYWRSGIRIASPQPCICVVWPSFSVNVSFGFFITYAAGEDFSYIGWNGVPFLYMYNTLQS